MGAGPPVSSILQQAHLGALESLGGLRSLYWDALQYKYGRADPFRRPLVRRDQPSIISSAGRGTSALIMLMLKVCLNWCGCRSGIP